MNGLQGYGIQQLLLKYNSNNWTASDYNTILVNTAVLHGYLRNKAWIFIAVSYEVLTVMLR